MRILSSKMKLLLYIKFYRLPFKESTLSVEETDTLTKLILEPCMKHSVKL